VDIPPVDIVLLQHLPLSTGFLHFFYCCKSFAPPIAKPRVACFVSHKFLVKFSVFPVWPPDSEDFVALDVYTLQGWFGYSFTQFSIGNTNAPPVGTLSRLVTPVMAIPDLDFPYRVAGDVKIHSPAAYPLRVLSSIENGGFARNFSPASNLGYPLMNVPGTYTRFPFND